MEFPEIYSRKILRNFLAKIRGNNLRIFIETNSQNTDPLKISQIGDQFWKISQKFPRNQSQTLVLEKFLVNSSKQVTKTGELGEIPHFCYLEYGNL